MKRNMTAKIMAGIALGAILVGMVGTSLIFIFWATNSYAPSETTITAEELNELIESASGSIDINSLTE